MSCIINSPKLKQPNLFPIPGSLSINLPSRKKGIPKNISKSIPKLLSLIIMHHLHPLKRARSFNNQVILAIIDHNFSLSAQDLFHQMYLGLHEIQIHRLIDLGLLCVKHNILPESVQRLHIKITQILVDNQVRIGLILGNVIDINPSSHLHD